MSGRSGVAALVMLAVVALVPIGATAREQVLEHRCRAQGGAPAWLASSPADQRPDGYQKFHCQEVPE